ncbi:MAG TPA: hypothetical protein VJK54_00715 [Chthoniobacterales bacterium]|nr:hypothetical protein [Chthoniobacterales bacterium]
MFAKTTLELPDSLFRQVKAAALRRHTTMKVFFNEALTEKLSRESKKNTLWHQSPMPPPPDVPLKELSKIHKELLADASKIHPGDWQ